MLTITDLPAAATPAAHDMGITTEHRPLTHDERYPQQRLRWAFPGETGTHFDACTPCQVEHGLCPPGAFRLYTPPGGQPNTGIHLVCFHNQLLYAEATVDDVLDLPYLAPFIVDRTPPAKDTIPW